jgi:uncharacterized protein with PIN domain
VERPPSRAYVRFYAELNDHLRADQRFQTLEKTFQVASSAKDIIESFGVPHTEVELIVANGETVDLAYRVRAGDRLAVYPVFEAMDVTPELRVRETALREPKFVLDVHLGKLAAYLRMLGFDTFYRSCYSDPELVNVSVEEHRILLTRDRGLLKAGAVTHGYWLRETDSRLQAAEIIRRFDLVTQIKPFTRCMACNGLLRRVSKHDVLDSLPPRTAEVYDEYQQCIQCRRPYCKGSHYERMQRWILELAKSD